MKHWPSVETLHELLEYDAATGSLIWKPRSEVHFASRRSWASWNAKHAGKVAASDNYGYRMLRLLGAGHSAHRVIWAMTHGEWPKQKIDHVDGDPSNNRLKNLRLVDDAGNARNRCVSKNNKSGYMGVSWHSGDQRWRATIAVNGTIKHLGNFKTPEAAAEARKAADLEFGYHPNHGREPVKKAS